ncbi:MAG: hypothetical protein K2Q32_03250 [Alphaproteobacteria bacterium]|nr:hypothetical protein [Alphaproteobacteria bacterium]
MSDSTKNDNLKSELVKTEEQKYPSVSYVEELGSSTAEAICASMRAANDDAPVFGPTLISGLTSVASSKHIDADALANALTQLKAHAFPTPFFKGKFMQNFRVILGRDDT